jgi:hypothetical protein
MSTFMTKSIAAIAVAAVAAGLIVSFTATVPEARAEPQVEDALAPLAKGDRLPLFRTGADCSSRGWPHYEQSCQFDVRRSSDAPAVRIIDLR